MKKLLVLTFLGLAWCNVVFAKCVTGNCENGEGTYSWARNDLRGTEGWGANTLGNGKILKGMEKELTNGVCLQKKNMLENGKIIKCMDKEFTLGTKLDKYLLESG
jgi:hypothetical protein